MTNFLVSQYNQYSSPFKRKILKFSQGLSSKALDSYRTSKIFRPKSKVNLTMKESGATKIFSSARWKKIIQKRTLRVSS